MGARGGAVATSLFTSSSSWLLLQVICVQEAPPRASEQREAQRPQRGDREETANTNDGGNCETRSAPRPQTIVLPNH